MFEDVRVLTADDSAAAWELGRIVGKRAAAKRSDIERSVGGHAARNEYARKRRADRHLDERAARKMAVAASVASAPVTHNAITMVVASGAAEPVTAVHSDPSPPIDDGIREELHEYAARRRRELGD